MMKDENPTSIYADLITVREAAFEMGFTTAYVYKLIEEGKLAPTNISGVYFLRKGEVGRYLAEKAKERS